MRFILSLLTLAAAAAGSVLLLFPHSQDNALVAVADVSAGGVARLDAPAPEYPNPSASRFFGFALPPADPSAHKPSSPTSSQPSLPSQTTAAKSNGPASNNTASINTASNNTGPTDTGSITTGSITPHANTSWATDVVLTPSNISRNSQASVVGASPAVQASRDVPRDALVRDLQRELRRVGCYYGEYDGSWGAGSKRALQSFLERVNSTLPTDTPDLIQLTLVRGYPGLACKPSDGSTVATRQAPQRSDAARTAAAPTPPAPMAVRALPQYPSVSPDLRSDARTAATQPASAPVATEREPGNTPPVISFEGRMAVGAPSATQAPDAAAIAPLTAAAAAAAVAGSSAAQRTAKTRQQVQPTRTASQQQPRRRERAWTGNFFNQ